MFRTLTRTLALFAAVAVATLVVGTVSASAGEVEEYPPTDSAVSVDNESPAPGDTITITGENWPAGAAVSVIVGGAQVGTTTAGDDGTWTFEYTIPADAEAGAYEVSADGCEEGEVASVTITVGAAPAAAPEALPATGSSSTEPLVRTGAVLIAAGAVLVYAVRRRQQAAAS